MKIVQTEKTRIAKIYTLSDCYGNIFYVGCTTNKLKDRLDVHLYDAKKGIHNRNKVKNELIKSLNYKVIIREIDRMIVTGTTGWSMRFSARVLEREWTNKYIEMGFNLTNRQLNKKAS